MSLDEDHVAGMLLARRAPEMVEADLVQRGGRGVAGQVPAELRALPVGMHDHRHGIPAQVGLDAPLECPVAGVLELLPRRDRVDIGRVRLERQVRAASAREIDEALEQVMRPLGTLRLQHGIDGFQPFARFGGIGVVELGRFEHQSGLHPCRKPGAGRWVLMICPARPVSMPPRRSARNRLARCTQNASGNDPVRADQGQGFPHAKSDSTRAEDRRLGEAACLVGRHAVACRRRGRSARKDGPAGQSGRHAATSRRVAKTAARPPAQRPGIAGSRDTVGESQPDARRRRLRETRRNGFRAARPGRQAGARSAQARRGAPAAACGRVRCRRRAHGRTRSHAERGPGSRRAHARAEVEGYRCT